MPLVLCDGSGREFSEDEKVKRYRNTLLQYSEAQQKEVIVFLEGTNRTCLSCAKHGQVCQLQEAVGVGATILPGEALP